MGVQDKLASREDRLLIGGRWRSGKASFERRNPARPSQVVGRSARATSKDVIAGYEAASSAATTWRELAPPLRGTILRNAADLIEQRLGPIASSLTLEEGKTIAEARAETQRAAAIFRFHAGEGEQAAGEIYPSAVAGTLLQTIREPLGVICVITPWNFPIAIPAWKLAPALVLGNTVVWKPAEIASGTAVLLAETLVDAGLPDGVLNIITGKSSEIGDALMDGTGLRGVSFTGSNVVGRRIAAHAAQCGIKAQLELGGKNASVVLPDADLDRAATCITRSAMLSTGQRCTATSRAIVVDDVYEDFVSRLVDAASALAIGDPMDEMTDIGPLASAAQFETVTGYLEIATEEGLTPVTGGGAGNPADGYFVQPTIYTDVDPRSRIATEEIFGPVLAVIRAQGTSEAMRLANDSAYGLSGSIFTRDLRTALRCARQLEVGVVHLNGESVGAEPHVPFGGVKASGSGGREQGKAAREFFTETKTIYIEDV